MHHELSIACAVHDHATSGRYLTPSLDALEGDVTRILLDNEANALGRNLAHLFNVLLRIEGPPLRAFVHADVVLDPSFALDVLGAANDLEARGVPWGALGVVGRTWDGDYVWGHEVTEATAVCTLDSCCVVLDTRHGRTFDERTFDDVHCHVEDYCLQCHDDGSGVYVVPARVEHFSATYNVRGARWGSYPTYRRRLERKWGRRFGGISTT